MTTGKHLKADFASHRIIFEAKSQVMTARKCQFFEGATDDSVFSPEVEARSACEGHLTAKEGHFCPCIRIPQVLLLLVEGKGWFKGWI